FTSPRTEVVDMSKVYFNLANGSLVQDWVDTSLITTDDNWSNVPSIEGYLGEGLTSSVGANPATVMGTSTVLDVNANLSNPAAVTIGGVAEFETAFGGPVVALQGSSTARAPYLVIYLDATGQQNVTVHFNAVDIDTSQDNSVQPIAVQYRIGE